MKTGERRGVRDVALKPRERILTAAIRLFLEEGIGAVGVDRIVEEAEAALMTLYRHYGDKDGVTVAALEQWSAESIGWLADQVDRSAGDPEARFGELWTVLEQRLRAEGGGSLVVIAAIEFRGEPRHPTWKVIAEHQMAMRPQLWASRRLLGTSGHSPTRSCADRPGRRRRPTDPIPPPLAPPPAASRPPTPSAARP